MLHDLQIRCSRGGLPVSIDKLCDEVLKRDRATLYLFKYFFGFKIMFSFLFSISTMGPWVICYCKKSLG